MKVENFSNERKRKSLYLKYITQITYFIFSNNLCTYLAKYVSISNISIIHTFHEVMESERVCVFYFALFVCVCISITGKMSRCALTIYIMTLFSHTLTLQNVYNSIKSNTTNHRKPVFSFIKPLSPSLSSTEHLVLYYIWKIFGKYKSKQVYFMVNVVFLFEIRYKC